MNLPAMGQMTTITVGVNFEEASKGMEEFKTILAQSKKPARHEMFSLGLDIDQVETQAINFMFPVLPGENFQTYRKRVFSSLGLSFVKKIFASLQNWRKMAWTWSFSSNDESIDFKVELKPKSFNITILHSSHYCSRVDSIVSHMKDNCENVGAVATPKALS